MVFVFFFLLVVQVVFYVPILTFIHTLEDGFWQIRAFDLWNTKKIYLSIDARRIWRGGNKKKKNVNRLTANVSSAHALENAASRQSVSINDSGRTFEIKLIGRNKKIERKKNTTLIAFRRVQKSSPFRLVNARGASQRIDNLSRGTLASAGRWAAKVGHRRLSQSSRTRADDSNTYEGLWPLNNETIKLAIRRVPIREWNRHIYKLWTSLHRTIPV